jgi:hypothetical protein
LCHKQRYFQIPQRIYVHINHDLSSWGI